MPVFVKILARLPERPDEGALRALRERLLTDAARWEALWEIDHESFLDACPLVVLDPRRVAEMPEGLPDGVWLDLQVLTPVYEEGYERGDLLTHIRYTDWLDEHFPDCEVWHGNDCSDQSLKPWPEAERERLLDYFRRVGHAPYDESFRDEKPTR